MTAATLPAVAPASQFPRPPAAVRLRWAVVDSITMTRRNLLLAVRVPANLVFTIVQPAMFILLFRYVFGGAIPVHIKGGYVNYLVPGIFAQTGAFTSFGTAIALAQELKKGSIDRLRSMPMARSAVLLGRLGADIVRLTITVIVLLGLGYAVGFRFENGVVPAVFMVVVALALGLVVCCVSAFTGLSIKDEEAVQAFGFIWVFPLTFVSAAFVPISTMPGWMQAFAKNQPFTIFIETMRTLAVGGPVAMHAWQSAVWLVGLGTLFAALAVRAYRRA
jgi:ABC-2 type transport system permease protein/oleandomycin transport system permease protein